MRKHKKNKGARILPLAMKMCEPKTKLKGVSFRKGHKTEREDKNKIHISHELCMKIFS